jgi:hypothetical protein
LAKMPMAIHPRSSERGILAFSRNFCYEGRTVQGKAMNAILCSPVHRVRWTVYPLWNCPGKIMRRKVPFKGRG